MRMVGTVSKMAMMERMKTTTRDRDERDPVQDQDQGLDQEADGDGEEVARVGRIISTLQNPLVDHRR